MSLLPCLNRSQAPSPGLEICCRRESRSRHAVDAGRVSAVLQTGGLLADITVRETVQMIASTYREHAGVDTVIERAGLRELAGRRVSKCSGGEQQRLRFALALLPDPDLLILDEGAAGLDQQGVASFYERIEQVNRDTGCAVLMVSHDLQVVMRASDHVVCLNGHSCCEGTPETVSLSPAYLGLFGGAGGALALYRHHHTHSHDDDQPCRDHSHEDAA